jgi:hypothetical protein
LSLTVKCRRGSSGGSAEEVEVVNIRYGYTVHGWTNGIPRCDVVLPGEGEPSMEPVTCMACLLLDPEESLWEATA